MKTSAWTPMPSLASADSSSWPFAMKASLACHLLAPAWVLVAPDAWPWALLAVVTNHLLVTAAGLWPRSRWLGANMTRLPEPARRRKEVALTIDDGPDPAVTPGVLEQLDAAGAKATFFCIAERAARHPELVREILRRGHSIGNHTHRHPTLFSLWGPGAIDREVKAAQQAFATTCGTAPMFFRAPAGLRNLFLEPVLRRHGLRLVSWTRRGYDTRQRDPAVILARLTRKLAAGDILLLHDGHYACTTAGRPVVLCVLPALLAQCRSAGLHAVSLDAALVA